MIKLTFIAAIFAFSASFTQGATALTNEDYFKKGMELSKNKQEEKEVLYIKAAETGSANYQLWLANKYHFGADGFKQSDKDAAKWFLKAAEQGHPEAMMRYAQYKLNGWGVPQSNQEALKWFKKVATYDYDVSRLADKDDAKSCAAEAQFMIGIIYAYKLNDYSQAEYWIQQSANNGYIKAKEFMKEISKHK